MVKPQCSQRNEPKVLVTCTGDGVIDGSETSAARTWGRYLLVWRELRSRWRPRWRASPLIGAPSYPLRQRPRQGRTAGGLDQGPLKPTSVRAGRGRSGTGR